MDHRILEVEDKSHMNHGKLMVQQLTDSDLQLRSALAPDRTLFQHIAISGRSAMDPRLSRFVRDLQTGEGADFYPSPERDPFDDLARHRIWVCPLFQPFLVWLYKQGPIHVSKLPSVVTLPPDTILHVAGYRRGGPDLALIEALRAMLTVCLKEAKSVPPTEAGLMTFLLDAMTDGEQLVFRTYREALDPPDWKRWIASLMVDSGRYLMVPTGTGQGGIVPR